MASSTQSLLPDLPISQQAGVLALLVRNTFLKGSIIVREGDAGDSLFFIESGDVQLSTEDAARRPYVFGTLHPGDFFGEVALLYNGKRSATATALSSVVVYELPRANFDTFVSAYPAFNHRLLSALAERLATTGKGIARITIAKMVDDDRTKTQRRIEATVSFFSSWQFWLVVVIITIIGTLLTPINNPVRWQEVAGRFITMLTSIITFTVTVIVVAKQENDERAANVRAQLLQDREEAIHDALKGILEHSIATRELIQARSPEV